jgi:Protein of unknown function (DUF429)
LPDLSQAAQAHPAVLGVDFTCAPSPRKPITVAWGQRQGAVVKLLALEAINSLEGFSSLLARTDGHAAQGWIGGFDFPFGLPRVFVDALAQLPPSGWLALQLPDADEDLQAHGVTNAQADVPAPSSACQALIEHLHRHATNRQGLQALIDSWGQTWGQGSRPERLPHRKADTAIQGISSTSPLQTRYVPVGKMYFEGLWRLIGAGITLPGLHMPMASSQASSVAPRLALEAYPGWLAHEVLGRSSYKSDDRSQHTPERLVQRLSLIDTLEQGRTRLGMRLKLSPAQRDHLASDAQGDRLDAVLCMLQAAWGHTRWAEGDARCGLPEGIDPVEGWILTA